MIHDPVSILGNVWLALGAVWILLWFTNKRTLQAEPGRSRLLHIGLGVLAYFFFTDKIPLSALHTRFFAATAPVYAAGIYLVIFGAFFAVWARITLGRNWSATVTLKEDHSLIRTGPYSIVRHPIYSGLMAAMVGSAMVMGRISSLLAVAMFAAIAVWKLRREERLMIRQFGPEYQQYRQQVKALIPFLL